MRAGGLLKLTALAAGTAVAARVITRASRRISFRDKVVVIAGGSRGLGLVLARQLAAEGAHVALLARNGKKLAEAAADITARGGSVFTVPCDIGDRRQVEAAVQSVIQQLSRIDVLINDAGVIVTGPLPTMNVEDFRDMMDVYFWGPLYLTLSVYPMMKQRGFGRIVNISSIGGKVSVPHLVPYCAGKFALTGLSEGLRAELAKDNVLVTTVCPGMMRTGSHINAFFKGHNRAEYTWFSLANAMPGLSVSAESAARQIIEAARHGDAELLLSLPTQIAAKLVGLFPGVLADTLSVVNRLLPGPNGNGSAKMPGRDSTSLLAPSALTALSDRAAAVNNEA